LKGQVNVSQAKWCRPDAREVKLDANASTHADTRSGDAYLPHVASMTMREGLSLANKMRCNSTIAE
jgi:hypothetical protein